MRTRETQQCGDAIAIRMILPRTFLQHAAELLPEGRILLRLFPGDLREHVENPPRQPGAHRVDGRILLQHLPRDVERQICGIDHAFDETKIERQELFGVVHDEYAAHVQLEAPRGLAMPQVERSARRNVQQTRVLLLPLDLAMRPGDRIGEVVSHVAVELLVLLVLYFGARPRPQGLRVIDRSRTLRPCLTLRMRTANAMWSEYLRTSERTR